jgi:hypothetical protein
MKKRSASQSGGTNHNGTGTGALPPLAPPQAAGTALTAAAVAGAGGAGTHKGRRGLKKEISSASLSSLAISEVDISSGKGETINGGGSGGGGGGVHPLSIGHLILVSYRDGSHRTAKVVERVIPTTPMGSIQYYVHYHDFNRRMDEWIDPNRIVATEGIVVDDAHHHGAEPSQGPSKRANTGKGSSGGTPTNDGVKNSVGGTSGSAITTIAELGYDEHEGLDESSLIEHEEITKVKNIANVLLGKYKMECWYFSPFPKEYHPNGPVDCLYFCEFTLRFFKTKNELIRYQNHANLPRHPPGTEIYRDSKVSMFELDGAVEKIYCQNLCYFAKLFLDHKVCYKYLFCKFVLTLLH